jgi:hypothetical protein
MIQLFCDKKRDFRHSFYYVRLKFLAAIAYVVVFSFITYPNHWRINMIKRILTSLTLIFLVALALVFVPFEASSDGQNGTVLSSDSLPTDKQPRLSFEDVTAELI